MGLFLEVDFHFLPASPPLPIVDMFVTISHLQRSQICSEHTYGRYLGRVFVVQNAKEHLLRFHFCKYLQDLASFPLLCYAIRFFRFRRIQRLIFLIDFIIFQSCCMGVIPNFSSILWTFTILGSKISIPFQLPDLMGIKALVSIGGSKLTLQDSLQTVDHHLIIGLLSKPACMQFYLVYTCTVNFSGFPVQILDRPAGFLRMEVAPAVLAFGIAFPIRFADHHIDSFNTDFRCIRLPQDKILQILDDIRREGRDHYTISLPDIGSGMYWRPGAR
ncbi:hypothetical protein B194_5377 [Serratia plymuthica A30]|nr:hypothetical protein B194_5377 [Serratia plymuthica A30]